MPRAKSPNTVQVALRLPPEVLRRADKLAREMSSDSGLHVTRTDALRLAIMRGLAMGVRQEAGKKMA